MYFVIFHLLNIYVNLLSYQMSHSNTMRQYQSNFWAESEMWLIDNIVMWCYRFLNSYKSSNTACIKPVTSFAPEVSRPIAYVTLGTDGNQAYWASLFVNLVEEYFSIHRK